MSNFLCSIPALNTDNLLTARFALSPASLNTPAQCAPRGQSLLDQTRSTPGVTAAALADIIPMREGENVLPRLNRATREPIRRNLVCPCLHRHSRLSRGRANSPSRALFFTDDDKLGGAPIIVIDENLARHAFGTTNVVGRRL